MNLSTSWLILVNCNALACKMLATANFATSRQQDETSGGRKREREIGRGRRGGCSSSSSSRISTLMLINRCRSVSGVYFGDCIVVFCIDASMLRACVPGYLSPSLSRPLYLALSLSLSLSFCDFLSLFVRLRVHGSPIVLRHLSVLLRFVSIF